MMAMGLYHFIKQNFIMSVLCFQVVFIAVQVFLFTSWFSVGASNNISQRATHFEGNVAIETVSETQPVSPTSQFKYQPNWASLDSRPVPNWYEDAKIGIFIHWGIFSVPSFVGVGTRGLSEWLWYYLKNEDNISKLERNHPGAAQSSKDFMQQNFRPGFQYQDFVRDFTAEFFDPDHWADVFASSGAKYVVLTSKHHEGFTLWPSKRSWNWNAVDVGPHRNLLGDLASAVRKKDNLKFGVYHSLYEWYNPLYLQDKAANFTTQEYVQAKLMPELHEVVEKFRPEVLWVDGDWEAPCAYWNCTEFIAWLYNQSPVKDSIVTNDRWGSDVHCKHGGYLTCHDRYNPKAKQSKKWENCMTLDRESWGYRRNAKLSEYFTMEQLLTTVAQTISYGGNILINIGPTHDGRIAPIFEERLGQLGEWLKVNGDAIYGTETWRYPEDKLRNETVYYTMKESSVYVILLEWPDADSLVLSAPIPSDETTVQWLGYAGENLAWDARPEAGMTLHLPRVRPSKIPCQWAWTFKLTKLKNL